VHNDRIGAVVENSWKLDHQQRWRQSLEADKKSRQEEEVAANESSLSTSAETKCVEANEQREAIKEYSIRAGSPADIIQDGVSEASVHHYRPTSSGISLIRCYKKLVKLEEASTGIAAAAAPTAPAPEHPGSATYIIFTLLRQSPHMVLSGDWTEVQIVHLPNVPGFGLGIGIVGGASTGVVVKTVLPGSAADKVCLLSDIIFRFPGILIQTTVLHYDMCLCIFAYMV
ncbi:unnamed protein product, partial [Gongylonema pulchrum]|uniref:PDZ domain-containing protein n=1 Tax=Gongylonema pulchrum TaxID=637853 RepID=A0A183CZ45_9BILA